MKYICKVNHLINSNCKGVDKNRNAEQDIINAARKVFHEKGYKEATMRDIASEANINMAMLHYYYRSKDNLFFLVFDEAFRELYEKIAVNISNPGISIFDKIRLITNEYLTFFNSKPYMPPFIIGEVIRNPEKVGKRLHEIIKPTETFNVFSEQLQAECDKGNIRQISALTLVLNTLSLCVFPAISQPVLQGVLDFDSAKMDALHEERKRELADFIINAIRM
jgi:TetR/AcrR family transcriptional regulator